MQLMAKVGGRTMVSSQRTGVTVDVTYGALGHSSSEGSQVAWLSGRAIRNMSMTLTRYTTMDLPIGRGFS